VSYSHASRQTIPATLAGVPSAIRLGPEQRPKACREAKSVAPAPVPFAASFDAEFWDDSSYQHGDAHRFEGGGMAETVQAGCARLVSS
jgi:hypothetical protein